MGKRQGKMSRTHKNKQREYRLEDERLKKMQAEFQETERKLWNHFLWWRLVPITVLAVVSCTLAVILR